MKAMVCEAFGGPEVLMARDLPDPPPPGPGEVQIRISARGVQYVDVLQLAGKYQTCLLYTSPSPRDGLLSRMPSSA